MCYIIEKEGKAGICDIWGEGSEVRFFFKERLERFSETLRNEERKIEKKRDMGRGASENT